MSLLRYITFLLIAGNLVGCAHLGKRNTATPPSEAEIAAIFGRIPDPRVLLVIPKMRHDALTRCAQRVSGDTTAERLEKQEKYIEALKQMLKKLQEEYYYWDDNPNDLIKTADEHSIHLAMLGSPAYMGVRSGSGYEGEVYRQTIKTYEDMIVTAAHGICDVLTNFHMTISYDKWKSEWDDAGKNVAALPEPD